MKRRRTTWQGAGFPGVDPARRAGLLILAASLTGCASLGASGPSSSAVNAARHSAYDGSAINIVELDDNVNKRLASFQAQNSFAEALGDATPSGVMIGQGDVLDIQIWEAPPAVLFASNLGNLASGGVSGGAQTTIVPQQIVELDGAINIPFVGRVRAAGRSPEMIERDIRQRLEGKANKPQVAVRLIQNDARTATVLGEVTASRRIPLGPKGERLLDALASAGGSRYPVGKTSVQVTRGSRSLAMPLDAVIRHPEQNIRLQAGDLLTVLYQPFSFIALGAVQQSAEVPFEGNGFSLAQALGRIGGLRDDRANIKGVFIFRLEEPAAVAPAVASAARRTAEGRVPVIYRLNLSDAKGFFAAQDFQLRDKDVLYVSSAPGSDLQRFVSTVSALAFSTISIGNLFTSNKAN